MSDDPLSITFGALADPTRRAILARLADGELTVNELAAPFAMSVQAISKHLKVLEHAGLISRGQYAQYRPCRLEPAPLEGAVAWIDEHRATWTDRFDQLSKHLEHLQSGKPHQPTPKRRTIKQPTIKRTSTKKAKQP